MGCFSYLCKLCGKPVNSDSFSGEHCTIYFLDKGKVVEEMTGQYDSYGRVFKDDGKSYEWEYETWEDLIDIHFEEDTRSGFAIVHSDCKKNASAENYIPRRKSEDDPGQGWGEYTHLTEGSKSSHNLYKKKAE